MNTINRRVRAAIWCAAFSLTALGGAGSRALAHDDNDHERARQARITGSIRPLSEVLRSLAQRQPGKVLDVELEHEHGAWRYEITVLAPDGRVHKFNIDATASAPPEKQR